MSFFRISGIIILELVQEEAKSDNEEKKAERIQRQMRKKRIPAFTRRATRAILTAVFIIGLLIPAHADSKVCEWKGIEKIIAVGDIHGDYDNFVKILKSSGVVDERLDWAAGKTHFVQTGDIMDRGDYAKDAFDLLRKLEEEAELAGGKVHFLLGNHEEMNITGIVFRQPGYVSPKQFASFLPDNFREKREREFNEEFENSHREGANTDSSLLEAFLEKKWTKLMEDTTIRRLYVNTFNDDYGRWILEHNSVIKINDIIFSHGGVSERFSTWPLQKINDKLREELNYYRISFKRNKIPELKREILYAPDSPSWNRDIALKDENAYRHVVDRILANLDAKYMIIAHTPLTGSPIIPDNEKEEEKLRTRFDQRIWIIDTGISDFYNGVMSFLRIENGKFRMKSWRDEEYAEETPLEPSVGIEKEESREEVEYYLLKAGIADAQAEAVPGRTAAWKIELNDGKTQRRGFFKPIDDRRPSILPESYKYELAAYALDKLLDFNRIPPTIEREIKGMKGSLQVRIENCMGLDEQQMKNIPPPDPQALANALEEINVFENLVYSERKELDDILIQRESWKVYRVDFSEAFSPTPELVPGQEIKRCSEGLFNHLKEISDSVLEVRLGPYLNKEEIFALIRRKALIIQTIQELIAKKGKEAVLF
jgi:hypothetical protein